MIQVSSEARQYALQELCRRAGLIGEQWRQWRVEQRADGDLGLVLSKAGGTYRIEFPAAKAPLNPSRVIRKSWLCPGTAPAGIPDLVVPYATDASVAGKPLFARSGDASFTCTEDLLASIVLVLSRFEEIDSPARDAHRRYLCSHSLAFRNNFLDRPIVDEYGLALQQVLEALECGFAAPVRTLRVKVSHDVDLIGIPYSLREAAVQIAGRRRVGTGLRDLLSPIPGVMPGSLQQVIEICEMAEERGLRSALYWKASARSSHDSGYDIMDARVTQVIETTRSRGVEMGAHPGYETFLDPLELSREVSRCRRALGDIPLGGRQHYLRWSPETWAHWEQCGLAYDSSVGFAERVGFRAGTCVPYRPWLWGQNRRARLLEIPLLIMDRTLVSRGYMGLTPAQSMTVVQDLMRKCEAVGGVLTLLWHNNCLGHPYANYYSDLLDALRGAQNYDWEANVAEMQRDFPDFA